MKGPRRHPPQALPRWLPPTAAGAGDGGGGGGGGWDLDRSSRPLRLRERCFCFVFAFTSQPHPDVICFAAMSTGSIQQKLETQFPGCLVLFITSWPEEAYPKLPGCTIRKILCSNK